MSSWTLHRRLRDLNVSFNDLVRGARRELALRYVAEPHIALTEIAFLLGYSELSAFSRAFHQWTGMSPVRYRRERVKRRANRQIRPVYLPAQLEDCHSASSACRSMGIQELPRSSVIPWCPRFSRRGTVASSACRRFLNSCASAASGYCVRPSIASSGSRTICVLRPTGCVGIAVAADIERPAAPIICTSTSVFSGATFSASLAATAANSAGTISHDQQRLARHDHGGLAVAVDDHRMLVGDVLDHVGIEHARLQLIAGLAADALQHRLARALQPRRGRCCAAPARRTAARRTGCPARPSAPISAPDR